ncbi:AfsR/SARP family transcriptional regulator [Nonomuraea rhizosphaerae]|uniref:AfsR/SARP family transcriptional regulator n=1 Tax=Nonomuraea rhizosphaerae TaxID=2665663 RepID=UPI001C5FCF6D|nr:tetratricopeptide repeat protein [Nonomuraea rhizosphaerae]
MGVRFAVLGPVQVMAGDRELTGLAPRHRAVLAYLLLHARTVLSADQLSDAVWGVTPPDTARSQIQAAITAIRRVLREEGAAQSLVTRAGGYMIEPEWLDLDEFTARMAAAQQEKETAQDAVRQVRDALALWRGQPLADVHADYVESLRGRLEQRRLAAIERLADLELSLGRHEDLIDELSAHVAAHPLRERLSGQLMLALHRSGRQADALSAGRAFREALVEQQGLDPGRAFVAIEQAILRDDPELQVQPQEEAVREPERRANFVPYDIPDFAGRTVELERIAGLQPGTTILTIDGMAGIGKSALAIHAAHRLAERYPDGQLFVDLQAHTAGHEPVEAGAALETLSRQLGVPAERIPASLAARAALWRAELAERRVVIVLDNATDTDHVRPLLPGASDSLVLITSRRRLIDLDGARALSMDVLPVRDGERLFASIVGERAQAEPDAVLDVLQLCGFLPLAVRIAAARLHHRPRWTVGYLAGRLRDERRRLAELSTSDRGVAAAFTLSYQHLDAERQRMFRLLGVHPGRDIDAHAAGALAGIPADDAETLLEDLLDAHVLAQHEPGRYTFHDLLREHARATASAEEGDDVRHEALTRLFDHYRATAAAAIDVMFPFGKLRRPPVPDTDLEIMTFRGEVEACAWLEVERANLVAVGTHAADGDWPAHAGQLAAILHPYLDGQARHADAITLHTKALEAARRRGDRAAEGRALLDLAWVYWRQGRYEESYETCRPALDLCREIGDRLGESRAHNTLGNVCLRQHDYERADHHLEQAVRLSREIGNRVGEAHTLSSLGISHDRQGRYPQALDHHRRALELHRQLGSRNGEARVLDLLGQVYQRHGQHEQARDHHRQALELYRELGCRSDEAAPLNGLGEVGRVAGDPDQAVTHHGDALAIALELGNRPEEARAHEGLAYVHREGGRLELARDHAKRARDLYTDLGVPDVGAVETLLKELD